MFSILVVEDDETLNKLICAKLKKEDFNVFKAFDGGEALNVLDKEHIDLIISDIMMPNIDGYELTKELRDASYTLPILMITAKNQMEDMEKGFLLGSDDYMIKPINLKEMILRVNALLRRAKIANERKIFVGNIVLDYDALTVKTKDELYELPKKEFYLLFKLLSYPNKIFTRQELMDEIWGMDIEIDERTVDSHIKKLRRKFNHVREFEIVTVRGLGYKVRKDV
ncbi:response regulator transcription factor [Clostridium felsineum]|uniref:Heme response regulator HssR n=1 Tax=Clostridium felsineum TaxID=36839 RepID=A0A1S8LAV2_9CLOT|nr:response regulator transcription factor [Clostridium felsineum]MCR3758115.1 response regulator transcription factor [Clostridium felsineum]URZ06144.1 Heme response regulator HssR [Clostridium felsineum]URZ11179.1 Heme response regulator HssR [Clostridium felsineum]URZ15848.1 Heme response regulator HssR [Clostridium felsineum DSM 794]